MTIRSFTKNGWNIQCLNELQEKEMLVKTIAFGINKLDIERMNQNSELVSGLEISGVIESIGNQVTRFKVGDLVMALVPQGGFSTYTIVNEAHALAIPDQVDPVQAAALPEALFTTWLNLFQLGKAKKGESVFIQGASGGIGIHAALLARAMGLDVIVAAGNSEKQQHLKNLGFKKIIDYTDPEWKKTFTKQQIDGVDIIFDLLGPKIFSDYFDLLNFNGRIVMIDALLGDIASLDVGMIFVKQLNITGSLLQPQHHEVKTSIREVLEKTVIPLLISGHFFPVIGKIFHGHEALKEALFSYENRQYFGKIIVKL